MIGRTRHTRTFSGRARRGSDVALAPAGGHSRVNGTAANDMNPQRPSTPEEPGTNDTLTRRDLEQIANPMSVILGYTQLFQRRVRRGATMDDEEMLRVLGMIEQASRALISGLAAVSEKVAPGDEDSRPSDGDP